MTRLMWISEFDNLVTEQFVGQYDKFIVTKSKSRKPEEAWQTEKHGRSILSSFWHFLFDWIFKPVGRRPEVVPHILGVSHLLDKIGDGGKESKPLKHNGVRLLRTIAQNPVLDERIYESEALRCLIMHLWAELVSITPCLVCLYWVPSCSLLVNHTAREQICID
jgi:hypothetical protein